MKSLKLITYGVMHLSVAITVTYALTGSWIAAMSVGIIEPLVQTGFYSLHEKLWKAHNVRKTATIKVSDSTDTPLLHC